MVARRSSTGWAFTASSRTCATASIAWPGSAMARCRATSNSTFMTVGTMLERAENVSRLLDAKYHYLLPRLEDVGGPIDRMQWAAVLRSASALEAYRRVYGNQIAVDKVVEFLLFDSGFPRSARFCIDRLEAALERIEGAASESPRSDAADSPSAELAHGAARKQRRAGDQERAARIPDGSAGPLRRDRKHDFRQVSAL